MYILGISAFYHDSAAALIKDGKVICAAEEERFSRIKHDNSFPLKAIEFCLENASLEISDIDYVAYYEKPLLKFERILETFVKTYPFSHKPFLRSMPEWLSNKIKVGDIIKGKLGFNKKIYFIPHHLSHAAAAFYPSSFKKSAILTIDGVGEYATTGLWLGNNEDIIPYKIIDYPDSLGLLYSTFTAFLGFKVNNDEYKVMGLAAYGKASYLEKIKKVVTIHEDGSFVLDMKYFSFRHSFRMWSGNFEKLFGKPRKYAGKVTIRDRNLAASLQAVTEEIYFKILNHLFLLTKSRNLVLAGGVALNSLANGKIYENTPFNHIYNLGPAGDSGAAIGCSLYVYHSILKNKGRKTIESLRLGSVYSNLDLKKLLINSGLSYKLYSQEKLVDKVAGLLKNNKIVGWFDGRMEYGPRALGSRSILANPRMVSMKDKVNLIKKRELFRPFAGSVLQGEVHTFFEVPQKNYYSPFMNFCFQTKADKRNKIAAIVHADGTCRIQTVGKVDGRYYQLVKRFYKKTGIPCILNTSFNIANEPIVENPAQALEGFLSTSMDYLVLGDFLVSKKVGGRWL